MSKQNRATHYVATACRHCGTVRYADRPTLPTPRRFAGGRSACCTLFNNGISHVVMMASPKDLDLFAIGFSLSEGIIAHPQEIYGMDVVKACNGLEVQIELSSRRFMGLKERRRALAGRTGCGVCGG